MWRSLPIGIEEALPPYPTHLHTFLFCTYKGHSSGNPYFLCWWVLFLLTSGVFGFINDIWTFSYSSRICILAYADPKDPSLRKLENSFLLGPVLVYARFYYFLTLSITNLDDAAIFFRDAFTGNRLVFLMLLCILAANFIESLRKAEW